MLHIMNKWLNQAIRANKSITFLAISVRVLYGAVMVLMSYSLTNLLDSYTNDNTVFFNYVLITITLLFSAAILSLLSDAFRAKYLQKVNVFVREQISKNLVEHTEDLLSAKNTGKKLSWFVNDVPELEDKYFSNVIDVFHYFAVIIMAIISIIMLHYLFALAVLVLFLISAIVPGLVNRYTTRAQKELTKAREIYTEGTRDNLESLNTLFIANKLQYFQSRMTEQNDIVEKVNYCYNMVFAKTQSALIFVNFLSQIGLMIFALCIASLGYTTIGSVLSVTALAGNLFNSVQGLMRTLSVFAAVSAITDKYEYKLRDGKIHVDKVVAISLKNISVNFAEKQIFKNFNYIFTKQRYAIKGSSGSGKSTLMKVLLGVQAVNEGQVFVNDIDIKNLNLQDYFRNIAYIEQNVYLLNGTIRDNILLGSQISVEKLDEIIKLANLDKFVANLPDGLDTKVSSNGQEISGGEKQRIAIARALVKNVDFLFIDEATSQLDPVNRAEIENILLTLPNVGLVMISHNFDKETLAKFDAVIDLS